MRRQPPPPSITERQRPGLSQTLPFPRILGTCQSCGIIADPSDGVALQLWRECDEFDQNTPVIVSLCVKCADRLIKPHARLYRYIDHWSPVPGAMELCVGCRFGTDIRCSCPLLKANGGPGMMVRFPKPNAVHLNYGGGRGEFKNLYHGPASSCAGRDLSDGSSTVPQVSPAPETTKAPASADAVSTSPSPVPPSTGESQRSGLNRRPLGSIEPLV